MPSEKKISEFRSRLRGPVFVASDEGYDLARALYNGMIDKRPALIAQCVDLADVIDAVNFGRDAGLTIAIRGGGHSSPGLGSVDDGLVIDLRRMRGIQVDPVRSVVHVQGGCTWGDVDHATHPLGLAAPGGFISTTGVGGLTLGGGVGYLSRRYGLTIDNLLGADVVLADGRFVTANARENPDLFWALRGGGGNFGVVTSFTFRLNPVDTIYGGPMLWPLKRGAELMATYRDYVAKAPEEINGWFGFMKVPPAPPFPEPFYLQTMSAIVWCDTGPLDQAERRMAAIRKQFGEPAVDFSGPMPWPMLQSMFDALMPSGLQWYRRSNFVTDLSDEAIDVHLKYASELPTVLSTMHLYPINGAVQRIAQEDTAFGFRDAQFVQMVAAVDPDPANNERMIGWAKKYTQELYPYTAGGGYVNMDIAQGHDAIRAAYRENYERLVEVKDKYDPENLFRVNQNIKPSRKGNES